MKNMKKQKKLIFRKLAKDRKENKNIDEEYEKAKKLLDEEAKRLKTEINSANGSLRGSLEFTLKNLEKRRAKLFEDYLSSNLNSLEN